MKYTFGPVKDEAHTYKGGTVVPSRFQKVYRDGKLVGEIEIHLHKNKKGLSFGITPVAYEQR